MAKSVGSFTWERGFREPSESKPWELDTGEDDDDVNMPPSKEVVTSSAHNFMGPNILRTWPTMYDGTNSPHGLPSWWKPQRDVDVLICGAGPSGLETAISLTRQGVSFRIVDKADGPLIAGRADGVQPRFLETLATWGLAEEVHEEGPLIERTAIYKDGKKLLFKPSHQSDSRYRGLHIITQGQVERIYIRDLIRHRTLVERSTTLSAFHMDESTSHPVRATLRNSRTGAEEQVNAKFLVGSDGAASMVRKQLSIPFDGTSTDIYWGILDCVFESDYPHAWVFGSVISSNHGGCVIIPREDGYIRLYTQLDTSRSGSLAESRQAKDASFAEAGGRVDAHTITPEEVLEQANKIFSPYKLKFAAPLSWFAVWKISERVARTFSSPDQRVHLAGDAAHVHSVMGAFGLNASIMDAANLAWKIGLVSQKKARLESLLPTYSAERRLHAVRIIETSGEYLRFVCNSDITLADVRSVGDTLKPEEKENGHVNGKVNGIANGKTNGHVHGNSNGHGAELSNGDTNGKANGHVNGKTNGHGAETTNGHVNGKLHGKVNDHTNGETTDAIPNKDLQFLGRFFQNNSHFLLGVDAPYAPSVISPSSSALLNKKAGARPPPVNVRNGVRAPNPRVCFSKNKTGYLYDKMTGGSTFHIVLFASSLPSRVRQYMQAFATALADKDGFYQRYGGAKTFNIVIVVECVPFELDDIEGMEELRRLCTFVFDDRAPDENAHTIWGADRRNGALVVVRPDLWVGVTMGIEDVERLDQYFEGFMVENEA